MIQKFNLVFVSVGFAFLNFACTNEPRATLNAEATVNAVSPESKAKATATCAPEMAKSFADTEGVFLDLDREALPKGLYLATLSELLLVKKSDGGKTGRLIAREMIGSRASEILCAENMEAFGDDFNLALLAPVKFDLSESPEAGKLTVRQFYVFSDKNGRGLILSNPELDRRGQDLKTFLNSGASRGRIVRYSDRQYAIRLTREQDGARALLLIRLDLVKSN